MENLNDRKLAEKVAEAGLRMVREYIAELRRQGRVKGKLFVVIKDGKRERRFPYHEN